jgi:hypothetical protein
MRHFAHHIGDYAAASWTPGRWTSFNPTKWLEVPDRPAVYAIYLGGELVYIGQSANLRNRLQGHYIRFGYANNIRTPWGDFPATVRVSGKAKITKRFGDWAMWELRLIERLRPTFNKTFVNQQRTAGMYA